ncbi:MAG: hypothetical protein GX102_15580 [Porphyromonadaceae bacterium]|jgi:hypothetical protein|nr:hypothetical protein [Porphyromonadaceae bacterium]
MTTPETNNSTEAQKQPATTVVASRKPNRFVKYILNHKLVFSLLFALIVVFIWGQIKINKLEKDMLKLGSVHAAQMDSSRVENYKSISNIFSWAVRSDLMRGNLDQASRYLNNVTKEPYIRKAYIVDLDKKTILLSTKKSEIGLPVSDITLLQSNYNVVKINDSTTRFTSPITGLNTIVGVSVLEADFR